MMFEEWFKFDPVTLKVLGVLMLYRHNDTGYAKPSTKELLRMTGLKKTALFAALGRLQSAGTIERLDTGNNTREFHIPMPRTLSVYADNLIRPDGQPYPSTRTTYTNEQTIQTNTDGESVAKYPISDVRLVSKESETEGAARDKKPAKQPSARRTNYLVDGEKLAGHLMVRTKRSMSLSAASIAKWGEFAKKWGFDEGVAIIEACLANPQVTDFMGDGKMAMNFAKVHYYAENFWKVEKAGPKLDPRFM